MRAFPAGPQHDQRNQHEHRRVLTLSLREILRRLQELERLLDD